MKKYLTLIVFLLLVTIWSMYFSTIKFYVWSSMKSLYTLEQIAGYLSLGSVFAYLIGGSLAVSFRKKTIIAYISFIMSIVLLLGSIIGYTNFMFFVLSITIFGFLYGLWAVVKNILIGIEIKKTGLTDNVVNAFVTICFLIAIIFGAVLGGKLVEIYSNSGIFIIIGIMVLSLILSLFLDSEGQSIFSIFKKSFKKMFYSKKQLFLDDIQCYFSNILVVWKKYKLILLICAVLWSVSTIFSQRCIEFVTTHFQKTDSQAAYLLLYSSIGIILGNVLTMFIKSKRWFYFNIFNIGFSLVLLAFIFFSSGYQVIIYLSVMGGFFFGAGINLIEAYYFNSITQNNIKEYGSSTFSLILSIIMFIMMQISTYTMKYIGFDFMLYFMLVLLIIVSGLIFNNKDFTS